MAMSGMGPRTASMLSAVPVATNQGQQQQFNPELFRQMMGMGSGGGGGSGDSMDVFGQRQNLAQIIASKDPNLGILQQIAEAFGNRASNRQGVASGDLVQGQMNRAMELQPAASLMQRLMGAQAQKAEAEAGMASRAMPPQGRAMSAGLQDNSAWVRAMEQDRRQQGLMRESDEMSDYERMLRKAQINEQMKNIKNRGMYAEKRRAIQVGQIDSILKKLSEYGLV